MTKSTSSHRFSYAGFRVLIIILNFWGKIWFCKQNQSSETVEDCDKFAQNAKLKSHLSASLLLQPSELRYSFDFEDVYSEAFNKIIMRVTKQRNPYLKRLSSQQPHKYSYDLEKDKYFLHSGDGSQVEINKTGTLKPKYKHYFSGFASHKQRYSEALKEPKFMHFVPDTKYNKNKSFYTPTTRKFSGYAQYPYKIKQQFPQHLCDAKPGEAKNRVLMMRKCHSEYKKDVRSRVAPSSDILQHSATAFVNVEERDRFFNMSFTSMTESKPLPKKVKKTCYNYKCKNLKFFHFDEKSKVEQSTNYSESSMNNTLSRSFHDSFLRREQQESQLTRQRQNS